MKSLRYPIALTLCLSAMSASAMDFTNFVEFQRPEDCFDYAPADQTQAPQGQPVANAPASANQLPSRKSGRLAAAATAKKLAVALPDQK